MSSHGRREVSRRIARIHGHLRGIAEMLDEGRPYSEVVHQITAVRAALDRVIQIIVDDLAEDCFAKAKGKEPFQESLLELQSVVQKIRQ